VATSFRRRQNRGWGTRPRVSEAEVLDLGGFQERFCPSLCNPEVAHESSIVPGPRGYTIKYDFTKKALRAGWSDGPRAMAHAPAIAPSYKLGAFKVVPGRTFS
jgi:hypothetical protein